MPPLPEDAGFWYPRWREMWEESLDDSTRKRINSAVWSGSPLTDPVEARYAVTLARKKRGAWRWWPAIASRRGVLSSERTLEHGEWKRYGLPAAHRWAPWPTR